MKNNPVQATVHEYMSGVDRSKKRTKNNNEVFTPTELVRDILEKYPNEYFTDPTKTFLDPSCGDGQILLEVVLKKVKHGCTLEQALSTTYGVEKESDNAKLCRDRLLCGHEEFRHIVEQNILVGNMLDPTADVEGQTELDKTRMRDLFYKDLEELIVDELGLPLPIEKHKKHHKQEEFIINTSIFEEE